MVAESIMSVMVIWMFSGMTPLHCDSINDRLFIILTNYVSIIHGAMSVIDDNMSLNIGTSGLMVFLWHNYVTAHSVRWTCSMLELLMDDNWIYIQFCIEIGPILMISKLTNKNSNYPFFYLMSIKKWLVFYGKTWFSLFFRGMTTVVVVVVNHWFMSLFGTKGLLSDIVIR